MIYVDSIVVNTCTLIQGDSAALLISVLSNPQGTLVTCRLEVPVQDLVERTEQMGELAEVAEVEAPT